MERAVVFGFGHIALRHPTPGQFEKLQLIGFFARGLTAPGSEVVLPRRDPAHRRAAVSQLREVSVRVAVAALVDGAACGLHGAFDEFLVLRLQRRGTYAGLPRLIEIESGAVVVRIEQSILLQSGADERDETAAVELLAPPSNIIAPLIQVCVGTRSRPRRVIAPLRGA